MGLSLGSLVTAYAFILNLPRLWGGTLSATSPSASSLRTSGSVSWAPSSWPCWAIRVRSPCA
eukprot:14988797-Alexandrium_andersonii.AAC.1